MGGRFFYLLSHVIGSSVEFSFDIYSCFMDVVEPGSSLRAVSGNYGVTSPAPLLWNLKSSIALTWPSC